MQRRVLRVKILGPGLNRDWQRVQRPLCVTISLCLHAILVLAVISLPPLPEPDRANRELAFSPLLDENKKPRKIIWLRKGERLPQISPVSGTPRKSLQRQRSDDLILRTDPPNPTHRDQYIQVDRPKTIEQQRIQSPNFVQTEVAPAPNKPVPKTFVPPPDRPKAPSPSGLDIQEPQLNTSLAPRLENLAAPLPQDPRIPKPPRLKFTPPPERPREVTRPKLVLPEAAPVTLAESNSAFDRSSVLAGILDGPKPAPEVPVAPRGKGAGKGSGTGGEGPAAPEIPSAQGPTGPVGPVSAVVISSSPSASNRLEQPEGNRAARIESGRPAEGSPSGKGTVGGDGLIVPGVTLSGGKGREGAVTAPRAGAGPSAPKPEPMAPSIPPAYRPRLDTASVSIPLRPATRRVPQQVETHFQNRIVYCTVLPGPSGLPDWTVWFGEPVQASPAQRTVMRPPLATRIQLTNSVTKFAESGRVWVAARLRKDGRFSSVSVPPGTAPRLASELAAEMLSWVFTPAIRNGEAVEVDLILEARLMR